MRFLLIFSVGVIIVGSADDFIKWQKERKDLKGDRNELEGMTKEGMEWMENVVWQDADGWADEEDSTPKKRIGGFGAPATSLLSPISITPQMARRRSSNYRNHDVVVHQGLAMYAGGKKGLDELFWDQQEDAVLDHKPDRFDTQVLAGVPSTLSFDTERQSFTKMLAAGELTLTSAGGDGEGARHERRRMQISCDGRATIYTNREDFDNDAPGLPVEDFENSNFSDGVIGNCGNPFNASLCYPPGDIEPGFTFTASAGVTVVLTPSSVGLPSTAIAVDLFAAFGTLGFSGLPTAIGFDFVDFNAVGTVPFVIRDAVGAEICTESVSATESFFGVVANQAILEVQLGVSANIVIIDNLAFSVPVPPIEANCIEDVTLPVTSGCAASMINIDDGTSVGDSLTQSIGVGASTGRGVYNVILTATDTASGSTQTCTTVVTLADQEVLDVKAIDCGHSGVITPCDVPVVIAPSYQLAGQPVNTKVNGCAVLPPNGGAASFQKCLYCNPAGKIVDKSGSCVVSAVDSIVSIADSGGVADHIVYDVAFEDGNGASVLDTCTICVEKPKKGCGSRFLREGGPFSCGDWTVKDTFQCGSN